MTMLKHTIILGMTALVLGGCNAEPEQEPEAEKKLNIDYSKLQSTPQDGSALVLADSATLDSHLKNGIRLHLQQYGSATAQTTIGRQPIAVAAPTAGDKAESFSTTNVHVAGVDEADLAKYDGKHWFIGYTNPSVGPQVKIAQAGPDPSKLTVKSDYMFDPEFGTLLGLYTQGADAAQDVVAIGNNWGNVYGFIDIGLPAIRPGAFLPFVRPAPQNGSLYVQLLDVKNPDLPAPSWTLKIDGSFVDSRKIGDVVYIVSRFDPWIDKLETVLGTDEKVQKANEKLLEDTPVQTLLPKYSINGEAAKPLSASCFVPKDIAKTNGLNTVVNITAIDVAQKKIIGSNCINANFSHLNMSETSAYLTAQYWDTTKGAQTLLHKFNLTKTGTAYAASGKIDGNFDGGDPAFRLNEKDGNLRVVTSRYDANSTQVHKLSVLQQKGDQLVEVATLPNAANPAPIGKPGERIYGVRFMGDKAYVVTFRRTDPLYVIGLADPLNPTILGELEIPGFATYIHPVGEKHLFTLGNSADETGRVNGVKVELLDVANPKKPKLVDSILVGGPASSSSALFDIHALSFLQASDDQLRITLPLNSYDEKYIWQNTGLHLFEINGLAGTTPHLRQQGVVITDEPDAERNYPKYFEQMRGLLHGDAVYVAQNGDIWSANWQTPKTVTGPVNSPSVFCTQIAIPAVTAIVKVEGAAPCKASVVVQNGLVAETLKGEESRDGKSCQFIGGYKRSGNYWVSAFLEGYTTEHAVVRPQNGQCYESTQKVELTLKPAPNFPIVLPVF